MRVLIADDDAVCRGLLRKLLLRWGYDVHAVCNGQEAIDAFASSDPPNVAILDWNMPGTDGIDVCRQIKKREVGNFTYTILLTGRDTKEDMVKALDSGADDYIAKPVDSSVLRSRLASAARIVEAVPPVQWSTPRIPGYHVHQLLGKGSVGSVWSATHEGNNQQVALKILRRDLVTKETLERFKTEIRIMQRLSHPYIANIHDSCINDTYSYYAMELIDGKHLDQFVRRNELTEQEIVETMAKVCDAVEYAHKAGVIHRDLKPQNILIDEWGRPKVLDFGVAKSIVPEDVNVAEGNTLPGSALGTPMFMSPEQAMGFNEELDVRSDVYSLGVILYVLLSKHHPCQLDRTSKWSIVKSIADGQPRPLCTFVTQVNRRLDAILMKALSHEPHERFATAGRFARALRMVRQRDARAA